MKCKNINKFFCLLLTVLLLYSCNSLDILSDKEKNNFKYYEKNETNIIIDNSLSSNFNNQFDDYYNELLNSNWKSNQELNKIKSIKPYRLKENERNLFLSLIYNDNFISIDDKSNINFYDLENFNLINKVEISLNELENSGYPISIARIEDIFYVNYSNGLIISFNLDGAINWTKSFNDLFKTPIKIFNNNIILLSSDKIISLNSNNGNVNWQYSYDGEKILQHSGGNIIDINHLLFFILPNKNIGEIDTIFGDKSKTLFSNLKLLTSINNTNDDLHSYMNYLTYFDQKKYLHTFDIAKNINIVNSHKVNNVNSFYFFSNSLITLNNDGLLRTYNILNTNLFWEITLEDIVDTDDQIIKVISNNNLLIIFFKSGQYIELNILNGNLINKDKLKVKNISDIRIYKNYFIINQNNKSYAFFSQ